MDYKHTDIVDFHSHILPGADHGSSSVDTSLVQLKLACAHGVSRIIATPHFYPHRHTLERFTERRDSCAKELFAAMSADAPRVKLGAEVLLCEGLENLEGIEKLCISGTNTLLVELPFSDFRESYCDTVHKLIRRGFEVVLAHVDRYPTSNIVKMIDAGVEKLQVNADALTKFFKDKQLLRWAQEGLVAAIGSDIHGEDAKAYKNFDKAKSVLGETLLSVKNISDEIWNNTK